MVSSRSSRELFHLALKAYFTISMTLFLLFGSKYGYTASNQIEKSTEGEVSMTLSLRKLNVEVINKEVINKNVVGETLSDKEYFENIIDVDAYENIENENESGIDDYMSKHSYDLDVVNLTEHYYSEDPDGGELIKEDKEELSDGKEFGKEFDESLHSSGNRSTVPRWLQMVKEQNRLYTHQIVRKAKYMDIFYISAVVTDLSLDQKLSGKEVLNTVAINGWLGKKNKHSDIHCCFKHSGSVFSSEVFNINIWDQSDIKVVTAAQFICNISAYTDRLHQTFIGLSEKSTCEQVEYINLEVEIKPPSLNKPSFAVCGKIVYGNFSAARLLEWFEVNIALGVDHFSLFTYNVTNDTKTVLDHYQKEGVLNLKEFDFPLKMRYPRYLGQKYMMAYMDEQIAVFDCVQRFRRYTYIAVTDVDEFIMPKSGLSNYKDMMKQLLKESPKAAGFTLMTALYVMDWNKTYPGADFTIGQYTRRTIPMWDRRKSIIITDRVTLPSIWTHGFNCKPTFNRLYLDKTKVVVHHYRKCRSHWIEHGTCFSHRQQYQDFSMKMFLSKVRSILLSKRKMLLHY